LLLITLDILLVVLTVVLCAGCSVRLPDETHCYVPGMKTH
jgi:hypothetical protein